MYKTILNPKTGKKVSIYGKVGQQVLKKYLQKGGFITGGSRIPQSQFSILPEPTKQKGGFIAGGSRIPQSQFSVLPEPTKQTVKQTGGAKKCKCKGKCTCGAKKRKVKASKNVKSSGSLLKKDGRISAGEYYRKHGKKALGTECVIRSDGTKKCLKKRANGVVYWGKCAKKNKKCKEQIYGL